MESGAAAARAHWLRVLAAGGNCVIPRWTTTRERDMGEQVSAIPADVVAAVRERSDESAIQLGSLLLAAHAAVLALLSGERDVVTGYVPAPGAWPLPCPLSVEPGTWRELLSRTAGPRMSYWVTPAFRSRNCAPTRG